MVVGVRVMLCCGWYFISSFYMNAHSSLLRCAHYNVQISSLSLFSSNESLADVQTPYLKFLLLPFYKMLCALACPTDGAAARLSNVNNALSMGAAFLTSIEGLGGGEERVVRWGRWIDAPHVLGVIN